MTRYFAIHHPDSPIPGYLRASGSHREIERGIEAFRAVYAAMGSRIVEVGADEVRRIRAMQRRADQRESILERKD